tara:strand:+ start:1212 stop:1394 length:183 start_codon:yes stop_codon:yes gene_type:complete
MSLTNKIMFHIRAFKADIITEEDLEQAINEELHGPVRPPVSISAEDLIKFLRESKGELEY